MLTDVLPALDQFKNALTPGAAFTYRYEPPIISGNTSADQSEENVELRTVVSVTEKVAVFRTPTGAEVRFTFPPAAEISMVGASFVWTNSAGRRVLCYTPRGL